MNTVAEMALISVLKKADKALELVIKLLESKVGTDGENH